MGGVCNQRIRTKGRGSLALERECWETHISHVWGDKEMTFTTTDPKHQRYMEKLGIEPYKMTCLDGSPVSWIYKIDATYFKLPRPKRKVSETQRAASAERMRLARAK